MNKEGLTRAWNSGYSHGYNNAARFGAKLAVFTLLVGIVVGYCFSCESKTEEIDTPAVDR